MRLRSNRIDMDKVHFTTAFTTIPGCVTPARSPCAVPTAVSSCWISASPAGAASSTPPWMTSWWACGPGRRVQRRAGAQHPVRAGRHRDRWRRHPVDHLERTSATRPRPCLSADLANWLQQDRVLWLDHATWKATTPTPTSTPWPVSPRLTASPPGLRRRERLALRRTAGDGQRTCRAAYQGWEAVPPVPAAVGTAGDRRSRLAASYANYLIINGAVLMPAYGDPAG